MKISISISFSSFLIGIITSLVTLTLSGQSKFEKTLYSPLDRIGTDVIQCTDLNYRLIGYQYDNYYQWPITDFMMFEADTSGNLVWDKSYAGGWGECRGNRIIQANNSEFLGCGRDLSYTPFLVRINSNGDTVWTRRYGFRGEIADVLQCTDLNFAICGIGGDSIWPFISKIDDSGNEIWHKTFNSPHTSYGKAEDIIQNEEGDLVLCGFLEDTSFLACVSQEGDSLWMKKYLDIPSAVALQQTEDKGYVFCGSRVDSSNMMYHALLVRTDTAGNIAWAKIYGGDDMTVAYDMDVTQEGGFIICGYILLPDYKNCGWLARTNRDGDTLWTRRFGDPEGYAQLYSVKCTYDGGFILTGGKRVNDTTTNVYLIKTDETGDATWIREVQAERVYPLSVYPNPNNGIFTINPGMESRDGVLEIKDASGRTIYSEEIKDSPGKIQVDLKNCSPGNYAISLRTRDKMFSGRMIVINL